MADLVRYGNSNRDIEQAFILLKKGTQLLKYGRKGKPKFCSFRLSSDESSLIWISSSGERSLKLASVSGIIPGQRTAVFRRYLRPDKEYLSFSLIYNSGKRSLDLICKDKAEAEAWIGGIKALISSGQGGRSKIDGWSDGGLSFEDNRDLTSNSLSDSSASAVLDIGSPDFSVCSNTNTSPRSCHPEDSVCSEKSHVAVDLANMQVKGSSSDAFRVSVSSAPSTSSHGSAPDDCDAMGDVYIWGEVICDNLIKIGADKNANSVSTKADVLIPRLLESQVVLDVHTIACGVKHAAVVTRQGEVFTWGEESGGRLGHGTGKDITQPRLLESLVFSNVSSVACGEFHTCAITTAGELYSWGDGTHKVGLLGHGTDVGHWIPKRISGPLEGLQIAMVSCGPWHTALVTSNGQLFTFGDGTFGVLGHGDRESVSYPREVESLSGLRTIAAACGVWHTAAVVEVIVTQSSTSVPSGKLFTWGDGDKNRLGHGDKEPRLKPTCVKELIEQNFQKVCCGHSLTAGLTTSGNVFTMGSTVYGQLGNPNSDGKVPCLVEGKLSRECIEEITCGAYHMAVLTAKNEVYTWGKGANGRLGHGDIEDRKTPTLVEALKDRHVKFIACGSNYSAAICLHKWVSGADQSQCSACRQAFGFTRKRHNCYNCGLVHCHSCSSRKACSAALAPNPNKPYRVCDSCFAKLSKMGEAPVSNRKKEMPRLSGENKDRLEKAETRLSKTTMPSNLDLIKQLDNKAGKQGKKVDIFSVRPSQPPSLLQLRDVVVSSTFDLRRTGPKPVHTSSGVSSRSVSPFSRKSSPPRSATPVPTTAGLSFSKSIADGLKKTNELLNQEVRRLRGQVESLQQRCEVQELELQKSTKKAQEATVLAAEESAKTKAAKDVIKLLTSQLKDMAEKLPPGVYEADRIKAMYLPNGSEPNGTSYQGSNGGWLSNSTSLSHLEASSGIHSPKDNNRMRTPGGSPRDPSADKSSTAYHRAQTFPNISGRDGHLDDRPSNGSEGESLSEASGRLVEFGAAQDGVNARSTTSTVANNSDTHIESEVIEQYEPGVYITISALRDGTRDLKRVRFSRRRFAEHQAQTWWLENRNRVNQRYNVRGSDNSSVSGQARRQSEGGGSPASQY